MALIWQNQPDEVPYVYQEYPKWISGAVVEDAAEEAALLGADTLADRDMLIQAALDADIKIDRRWSDEKIRIALEQGKV
jgi:hypothetical protein